MSPAFLTIYPANISTERPLPFHVADGEAFLLKLLEFSEKKIVLFEADSKLWTMDTMDRRGARMYKMQMKDVSEQQRCKMQLRLWQNCYLDKIWLW